MTRHSVGKNEIPRRSHSKQIHFAQFTLARQKPAECALALTHEVRYYISSLAMGVKRFAYAVRSHWGIENSCHWSLDVTYREDESRIRDVHMRENFAWLNRFTLSLLKQHPGKESIVMKRRSCGWDFDFMTQVLAGTKS